VLIVVAVVGFQNSEEGIEDQTEEPFILMKAPVSPNGM